MLNIRQGQVEAFRQYHLRKFEDEMVEHLKGFAPKHWKAIGEQTGREVIHLGIEQAEKHSFTNRGPVRFYIEMMFLFGSFFDTDPQYIWIAEVLNDPEDMDQMVRADCLYDRLTNYWAQVAGPENSFSFAALRKLSQARVEDYLDQGTSLENCLLRALEDIYPQKFRYVGEPPLRLLLKKTFELAKEHGFTSSEEIGLMAALTYFLGHECGRDPLHSWIGRRLVARRFTTSTERGAELQARGRHYLNYILKESGTL
jgi:hypothetical protein